jgi:hypothetical protein
VIGAVVTALFLRACFVALTQTRAFFLWSKPRRVGAFRPLLECGSVQIVERSQITAKVVRISMSFSRSLSLSLDGEIVEFLLKRKVRSLPGQAEMIDALCAIPMTSS